MVYPLLRMMGTANMRLSLRSARPLLSFMRSQPVPRIEISKWSTGPRHPPKSQACLPSFAVGMAEQAVFWMMTSRHALRNWNVVVLEALRVPADARLCIIVETEAWSWPRMRGAWCKLTVPIPRIALFILNLGSCHSAHHLRSQS